jgi:hypothetical protein
MQVSLVPVVNVDSFWPSLREGFQRALLKTGGDLTTGDLWVQCRNGSAFLLVASNHVKSNMDEMTLVGASIWRPDTWQSGRKLRCLALYGSGMNNWIDDMRALAADIARNCGATSLVSEGRLGWQRIFPKAKVLRALYEETL